ncbi:hypothetical protein DSO57_1038135 [Entomophthora muscae]|uniref:Uncharacterized protein n=1 Tax=Entomophthora muscae TaxID=34485 RepID=A0ACC2UJR8_9FUNG|nr:hypothetical protein DSO57_1038135 [Entomophthora muscae]
MSDWFFATDFYQFFLRAPLRWFGIVPKDLTYGRKAIPASAWEEALKDSGFFHSEKWIVGGLDGSKIYTQTWWAQEKFQAPKADIFYIHGYADHSGRFAQVCKPFLDAGFRIHLLDLPGHGRSDGIHGLFHSLDELSAAAKDALLAAKAEFKPTKLFLMGISMGGFTATKVAIEEPEIADGLIAVCPCIMIHPMIRPPAPLVVIGRLLKQILPSVIVALRMPHMASSDPEVDTEFMADPMAYTRGVRGATGIAMEDGLMQFRDSLANLSIPFLVLQGDKDRMVDPSGATLLVEAAKSTDKTIIHYPGVEHAMYSDPQAPKLIQDCLDWLNKRTCPSDC